MFLAVIILTPVHLASDESLVTVIKGFGTKEWLVLATLSFSNVYQSVLVFNALKYHKASAL